MSLALRQPALLVVSDGSGEVERVLAFGQAAARGEAWGFLVREPRLGGRDLAAVIETLRERTGSTGLHIIVSDRVDVALAGGAFGVQLGERSLPVSRVRAWVRDRLQLGRSVHDPPGAAAAAQGGADWLVFGHVYPTPTKAGLAPAGLAGLKAAVEAGYGLPVFAIGGIEPSRVGEVVDHGASGIAVIGAVARAENPERAVKELVRALAAAGGPRSGGEPRSGGGRQSGGGSQCARSSP